MQFSTRTNWDTTQNEWAQALTARRQRGLPVYDLTISNPTQCGFSYDPSWFHALMQTAALRYEPEAQGSWQARAAVCNYYRDHARGQEDAGKLALVPEQIVLTTSTSEAYSFLFRLLCNPGDQILIAQPSYPLFEFLAVLDDVTLVPYPLFYDHGWHIDHHALRQRITAETKAIVVVHPNNPTGHFTADADRRLLEAICVEFGLALIVDEVFLDYGVKDTGPSFATGPHPALTFVLSGLSKVAALPQMKVSWIAALGPQRQLAAALERLDVIADTFLSLNSPMQLALPLWLRERAQIQQQVQQRVRQNLQSLDMLLAAQTNMARLEMEGGWSAILRAPAWGTGNEEALWLMVEHGVVIHPGSFYGMGQRGHFVLSLLPQPADFLPAVQKLLQAFAERT